jgi:hypothetical protein
MSNAVIATIEAQQRTSLSLFGVPLVAVMRNQ